MIAGWCRISRRCSTTTLNWRTYTCGPDIEFGEQGFLRTARSTLDYLLTDLAQGEGGIFSAEDADSEGEEGRFYVWEHEEFLSVVGECR